MTIEVNDILKRNSLSVTESRRKILNLFLNVKGALAHGDIEKKAGERFDRVTVYRTLQTFVEKGIIHVIPTPDNSVRYALCRNGCSEGSHRDNHIHFTCLQCNVTYCLDETVFPQIELPKGFSLNEIEILVTGTCRDCRQ